MLRKRIGNDRASAEGTEPLHWLYSSIGKILSRFCVKVSFLWKNKAYIALRRIWNLPQSGPPQAENKAYIALRRIWNLPQRKMCKEKFKKNLHLFIPKSPNSMIYCNGVCWKGLVVC